MGCQCGQNAGESKSELINYNSNEITGNNFIKNNENHIDLLKSSISDSINNNNNQEQTKNITPINSDINYIINSESKDNYQDYSQKMFEIINKIRDNPPLYADEIEKSRLNITEQIPLDNMGKTKIIYKQRLKVSLCRGEIAFIEAAKELRTLSSISPLIFKNEICIPLPENEEDIKNTEYLKEQVKIIRKNNNINVFYKDLIKDPEMSALLMIVDDSTKNPGKKRQAILDENFKYIGISSGFIGKSFVAFFSLSK